MESPGATPTFARPGPNRPNRNYLQIQEAQLINDIQEQPERHITDLVNAACITALGQLDDRESMQAILEAMDSGHKLIRLAALSAAGNLGNVSTLPDIIRCVDDPEDLVRAIAVDVLGAWAEEHRETRDAALKTLIQCLSHQDSMIRRKATEHLHDLAYPLKREPLLELLAYASYHHCRRTNQLAHR